MIVTLSCSDRAPSFPTLVTLTDRRLYKIAQLACGTSGCPMRRLARLRRPGLWGVRAPDAAQLHGPATYVHGYMREKQHRWWPTERACETPGY